MEKEYKNSEEKTEGMVLPHNDDAEVADKRDTCSIGLSSGFRSLDRYIGGFKPGELIIIAAKPSVGKTSFALSIAANIAFGKNPVPIGFFSTGMRGPSLIERILASRGRINLMKLKNGTIDYETIKRLMETASEVFDYSKNFLIQDTQNLKLHDIQTQARLMVRQNQVKAIFIDDIDLVDLYPSNVNVPRTEQDSQVSGFLKQLALELEIPVICLCQVNTDVRTDCPPMLVESRDSESIEQDANLVIYIDDQSNRLDGKRMIVQYEEENKASENKSRLSVRPIKIIIAKQRDGSTRAFNLNFVSEFVSFTEMEVF